MDGEVYLLTCMRYIEMNPVRAPMVKHPGEYAWSSYAGNAIGKADILLMTHPLFNALRNNAAERQYVYRELLAFCI